MLLGDRLPELALGLVRQRDLVLGDGDDEAGVRVRLLLGGGKVGQADVLAALLERVGLVEALCRSLGDGLWRGVLCSWEKCQRGGEEETRWEQASRALYTPLDSVLAAAFELPLALGGMVRRGP